MLKIGNISLGRNTKRYTHDMSADNNTTMGFGFFQPLYTQLMFKGDKISLSMRQLVRLAPMPVPTFGRMKVLNHAVFVPISDVYPAFDAMLAKVNVHTSTKTYIPTELPKVTNSLLCAHLCSWHGIMASWVLDATNYALTREELTDSTAATRSAELFNSADCDIADLSSWPTNGGQQFDNTLEVEGCDFVFYSPTIKRVIGFKMSNEGKKVYSLLRGLGYSLEMANNNYVSAVPLLSFYKAWFDNYAPKRNITWSNTTAYELINVMYDNNITSLNLLFGSSSYSRVGFKFLKSLADCYYSESPDYYSAQTRMPLSNGDVSDNTLAAPYYNPDGSATNDELILQSVNNATDPKKIGNPYIKPNTAITLPLLHSLQRLSRFVAKDSVIGQRVSTWLRVHFGSDVSNDFFKDSYDIKKIETNCSVNDVYSTADTATTDSGEYLGAYAGKGLGFAEDKVQYDAPVPGYFMIMSCVVPRTSYYQGDDPALYGLTRYTLPTPDFDALGLELTPFSCMVDNNGINVSSSVDPNNKLTAKSFGYMPRYSGFKVKKDIVNGDMVRPSTIDSYSAYHLDKMLLKHQFLTKVVDGDMKCILNVNDIPQADIDTWSYPTKRIWLGNFNRIFYNAGNTASFDHMVGDEHIFEKALDVIDDNFIVQSVFDVRLTNQLKPIKDSYDTFEEETDNTDINVRTE